MGELAVLARLRGDAAEAALFSHAADVIRSHQIDSDADLGPLLNAPPPDTPPDLLRALRYMHEAGAWVLLESAIADLPSDLRWLFESRAVTIDQLATLHQHLGILSAADLGEAIRQESIRKVPGFDASAEVAIATALPTLRGALPRIPLGRAVSILDPVIARLREMPGVSAVCPVGALRRGEEVIGDIELLVASAEPTQTFEPILQLPDVTRTLHHSARRLYFRMDRVQIGIRVESPDSMGASLLHLTGTAAHLDALRQFARDHGWVLNADGLSQGTGSTIATSEEAIYAALDLPWIPSEIREGGDELVAAAKGLLPLLVTRQDIRGDLHMHTTWSDGRDTVADMVRAAVALGYEYIAITDHSPHSAATRNLSVDGIARQAEEIAAMREQYPQMEILHGCEVDILPNGRLDFTDRILERFDIVLASLHERAGHSPEQLFTRYEKAMRHPLVTLITHPTNRLVPHRPGYDLDYDRLFALAVETGTIVEIDGSPSHLDLNGALARRAIGAGCTVSIDSDSHRADALARQMDLGILMARRGWVEPKHVFNTQPVQAVRERIAAKRQR